MNEVDWIYSGLVVLSLISTVATALLVRTLPTVGLDEE